MVEIFGIFLFLIFVIVIDLIFPITKYKAETVVDLHSVIEKILPSAEILHNYDSNTNDLIVFFQWREFIFSINANYTVQTHERTIKDFEIERIIHNAFNNYQRRLFGGLTLDVIYVIKDFFLKIKSFFNKTNN